MKATTDSSKEFLNDSYKFEENSIITNIQQDDKDENLLLISFNKTILHPQGGGQPSDEGSIGYNTDKTIPIHSIIYDREKDIILHKVDMKIFYESNLKTGDEIKLKVNPEKRQLYARLHSGGHLLDIAVSKLSLDLVPGKGYHFPDGPYVEYAGKIDKNTIPTIQEEIEKICNDLISSTNEENGTISQFYSYEEGKKTFSNIPSYLPVNKPFRWVKLTKDDIGCPCGGTHVKHIKDIKGLKINKITNKGKAVRISYNVTI